MLAQMFDSQTKTWTKLPDLNEKRFNHVSCATKHSVIVHGGQFEANIDPSTDSFEMINLTEWRESRTA